MNKFTKICAVALAAFCAVGAAGCSSSSGSSSSLTSKWYVRTNYTGIQPSVAEYGEYEKLTYDISFQEDSGTNATYSVSYNSGHTMTKEFFACEFDWSGSTTPDGYLGGSFYIPEEYRSDSTDSTETVYCYTYSFEISGTYTYATGATADFTDKIESVCYFRSARNNLQPVYSYQYVNSTSPANYSPASPDDMYQEVEYEYYVSYNKDCTEATTYYTQPAMSSVTPATIDLSGAGNLLFDNGSVYMVMRAMNITSSLSMDIDILIPAENGYSTYNVTGADGVTLEDDTIRSALVDAGYVTSLIDAKVIESEDDITYSAATLSYTGDLSGTSQTIWYATLSDDTDRNYCRSTMLKIELPLSFGLGTLEFTLSDIESHFSV